MSGETPLNDTSGFRSSDEENIHDNKNKAETPNGASRNDMRPFFWLFGLCAVPQAAGVSVLGHATSQAEPLPPSQDPWYKAPPGFELKQPGDILRIRPAPGNLTTVVKNSSAAYHILYRTTDSRHEPAWAVTSLFLPKSFYSSPSGKMALLSYQFAYNTVNLDSSPSIGLYWRMAQEYLPLGIRSSTSLISDMLSRGWIVNTPDYMGPNMAFGAKIQAGHATLDSVRAVRNLVGMTGGAEINAAIWGYSGGSIATFAAAQLQKNYAGDLKISGTVLGGLVDDISADFDNLNKSPIAGTLVAFLLGITAQYPQATRYMESRLVPATKDEFLLVRDINVADAAPKFAGKDIYTYFIGGAADLQAPIMLKLYNEQAKPSYTDAPCMPMFVYKAIDDEYCPVEQTDATVKKFCRMGAEIVYERNTVGKHVSEIENGKPRAMEWLANIFGEAHKSAACVVRNVTVEVPVNRS